MGEVDKGGNLNLRGCNEERMEVFHDIIAQL